jgi:hypothetical protein
MENYLIIRRGNKMEQQILLDNYIEGLYLSEDLQYMEEGLKDVVAKFTQPVLKKIMPQMFKIGASKNPAEFEKLIAKHGIKRRKVKDKDIKDLTNRLPADIQQGAQFAKRVLDNSLPRSSKTMRFTASYFIAALAKLKNMKSPNLMGSIKAELKTFIPRVQSFYEEIEEKTTEAGKKMSADDMADIAIGIGSIVAVAGLTGMALVAGYFLLTTIMSLLASMWWLIPLAVVIGAGTYGFMRGMG